MDKRRSSAEPRLVNSLSAASSFSVRNKRREKDYHEKDFKKRKESMDIDDLRASALSRLLPLPRPM